MGPYNLGTEVTIFEQFMVDGSPTDPTTVTFVVERPRDTLDTFVFGVDAEVTNPVSEDTGITTGYYELAYLPPVPGTYNYKVVGTGAVVAVHEGSFDVLPSAIGATPALIAGPCEPWIDPQDVAECCSVELGSDTTPYLPAAQAATNLLYRLSAKLYPGSCERTVRPGSDIPCGVQVLARGYVVGWESAYRRDADLGKVLLPNYPVTDIVEVRLDGDVLAEDEYRLDGWRWLIRRPDADGNRQFWPGPQREDREDTEEDTFSITYTFGYEAPVEGKLAAAQLACEIYKSCPGNEGVGANCAIPKNATRVTRHGITIEMGALHFDRSKRRWDTGMKLVDAFLNAHNPNGLKRSPLIWSPDAPRFAKEVGTVMGS